MKIYSKHFRAISWTPFLVNNIFPSYRQGYNKSKNKMETFVMVDWDWKQKKRDNWEFIIVDGSPDFAVHKKVYDVEIELSEPNKFTINDEVKFLDKFTVPLSAWLIGEMMKATIAFGKEIPQNNGRDKYDWEEEYIKDFIWQSLVFSVSWEGIGTKYTFKEAKFEKNIEEKSDEIKEVEKILKDSSDEVEELF